MKNFNTTLSTYRVSTIRSQRAVEREKLEHPSIESNIGDYPTLEEAKAAYDKVSTGTEVDKELTAIYDLTDDDGKFISNFSETILTTY